MINFGRVIRCSEHALHITKQLSTKTTMKLFVQRLGLTVPIIQAPMAGVSTVKLAAEVAKSGGLGSLPLALINLSESTEPVFRQIDQFRELAGPLAKVNLNFFSHDHRLQVEPSAEETTNWYLLFAKITGKTKEELRDAAPEMTRINRSITEFEQGDPEEFMRFLTRLVEVSPGAVSFHFGVPSQEAITKLQQGGIFVMATATSVAEAKHLMMLGVDALVCQGYEAGGHRGNYLTSQLLDENLSTSALFGQIQRSPEYEKHKPYLIPAGGIMDGYTAAQYIEKGAAAVQMGTVFVPVVESAAPAYIGTLAEAGACVPTIMTRLVSGKPARTVRTPFVDALVRAYDAQPLNLPSYGYSYHAFKTAIAPLGEEYGFYLAGQNYHQTKPGTTADTMARLISELSEKC